MKQTGEVTVHKLIIVQDVGRAINPAGVEGQMMGGAVQGMGWALYENMQYDEYGQPQTATWMDYNLPHITQIAHGRLKRSLLKCLVTLDRWAQKAWVNRRLYPRRRRLAMPLKMLRAHDSPISP